MAKSRKATGLYSAVNDFFKRVNNTDVIRFGSDNINTYPAPITDRENNKLKDIQVFRQFLQSKNWNTKHIELFDEYRRMDQTFPIINAALKIYGQEVCLSGDTVVSTPKGDFTLLELFRNRTNNFYVKSFDKVFNRIEWNEVKYVKTNGIKPVYKVTLRKNVCEETQLLDPGSAVTFKCTDNHKIMVAPSQFKELRELKAGDSVWSMYYYTDPSCKCKETKFNNTVIESIDLVGEEEVFDLVEVSPNHHFLIKLSNTFHITVHNCTKDTEGNVINIVSEDKRVKKLLEDLFYNNLKLNSNAYLQVRSFLKFGNHYSYLQTRQGVGVLDLVHLPPEAIRIMLQSNSMELDDFKYQWFGGSGTGTGGGKMFEPWEVVHFKNIEDLETMPYGQSILRSVVDTYRRIILMREAMIVYRITRAPQRLLFKIDASGHSADDALRFAEELKKQMTKKPLINPQTGEMDFKYNPISIEENLYMTSYEGDTSDVRVLEGASNLDAVEDYKIIKDDLFAGLLIPKSYLTFEEDLCLRQDTKLLTNEGPITIKELADSLAKEPNKKVYALSCNKYGIISSGKILWCNETKEVEELYKITINGNHVVEATNNHPFLLESLKYCRAENLEVGNKLRNMFDEEFIVTNVEVIKLENKEFVYDLEVEEHHNFALSCGIFVHNSNKAALAQEDLRFAGAIRQYQAQYIEGLLHMAIVHLQMNGCSQEDFSSFKIQMNTNSTLAEKTRKELLEQRFSLAASAWDANNNGLNFMSFTQTLKEILHFTDEEIAKTFQDQMIEKKIAWRLKQLDEQGFYQDPDEKKQKLLGMNSDNNIFANLNFEAASKPSNIKSILSEKIDAEIGYLLTKPTGTPNAKLIDSITRNGLNKYGKIKSNIENTKRDFV